MRIEVAGLPCRPVSRLPVLASNQSRVHDERRLGYDEGESPVLRAYAPSEGVSLQPNVRVEAMH